MDFAYTFSKDYSFFFGFFKQDYTFYTKNLFSTMKDAQSFVKISYLVTCLYFLSVICQNFEYNFIILANFGVKTQKSTVFTHTFSKSTVSFFGFFNKDYKFYTKNLFFPTKDAQSFVKISYLVSCLEFLSVIHQNFEYNLRILANFRVKTQKSTRFAYTFSKNYSFFFLNFLIKIILFTLKTCFFPTKDAQSFVKIRFIVTCLHF